MRFDLLTPFKCCSFAKIIEFSKKVEKSKVKATLDASFIFVWRFQLNVVFTHELNPS